MLYSLFFLMYAGCYLLLTSNEELGGGGGGGAAHVESVRSLGPGG